MYALAYLVFFGGCCALAWLIAKTITQRAKTPWLRWLAAALLIPVVTAIPLVDEIVGYFQFESLCKSAKEVQLFAAISVEDLYTPQGVWKPALLGPEGFSAQEIVNSYLRRERTTTNVAAAIPIRGHTTSIYSQKDGRLLAKWDMYGNDGGWLSRVLAGGNGFIVRQQCMPDLVAASRLEQALLRSPMPRAEKK